jgi:alkylated DNA repair dioxygenase AlkB
VTWSVACRAGWRASYCFGNLYRDGQDTSGAHADRLTLLGVRPIIASLSLGASRLFRVRLRPVRMPLPLQLELSFAGVWQSQLSWSLSLL